MSLSGSFMAAGVAGDTAETRRPLTFEERVKAQEIIERFGYGYQTGVRLPFEQAVPHAVIEQKVRRSISRSRALEERWSRPITDWMLQAELERIARHTKFPDRLERLFHVLGDDPRVIRETLVRESLADRLFHDAMAGDPAIHAASKERWWAQAEDGFFIGADALQAAPDASVRALPLPRPAACLADDTWMKGVLDDVPDFRVGHTAVWTGREMIIWGGSALGPGSRYDPVTDTWHAIAMEGSPTPRTDHTATWTGQAMVILGGFSSSGPLSDFGGRYDPASDTWSPVSIQGAPTPRTRHTAVWTGEEVIVWGGYTGGMQGGYGFFDGGRYNPGNDTWTPLELPAEPPPSLYHNAVWTGREMIVWGGFFAFSDQGLRGAAYDPQRRSWRLLTTIGTPSRRGGPIMLWAGSRMIVWGGQDPGGYPISGGAVYDPMADAWSPISLQGAPPASLNVSAVWTGDAMLVAGPTMGAGSWLRRYDPLQDEWSTRTPIEFMPGRGRTAVWTGEEMILWGGGEGDLLGGLGVRYNAATDTWRHVAFIAPGQPIEGIPIWTGREMIIVGGRSSLARDSQRLVGHYDPLLDRWSSTEHEDSPSVGGRTLLAWTGHDVLVDDPSMDHGERYDPILDQWRPMATEGAPGWTTSSIAAWTGSEWLRLPGGPAGTPGGRYDPIADSWRPMAPFDAALDLQQASAVWTGREMIFWGAPNESVPWPGEVLGGRYDPITDSWRRLLSGPPSGVQAGHRSLWTGDGMLILEGQSAPYGSVYMYDPALDKWTGRPAPLLARRTHFSVVWTGTKALVWGGYQASNLQVDGYSWEPATDTWTRLSDREAPNPRGDPWAFWTGSFMLVYGGQSHYSGGAYVTEQSVDNDGDGLSECAGDCDDGKVSVAPGVNQICGDGLNNDCLDPSWPGVTDESDDDGDSWSECDGDCLDSDALIHPGAIELPGNTLDEDCDGAVLCDPSGAWNVPGLFMRCVSRACRDLAGRGEVSTRTCGAMISGGAILRR